MEMVALIPTLSMVMLRKSKIPTKVHGPTTTSMVLVTKYTLASASTKDTGKMEREAEKVL